MKRVLQVVGVALWVVASVVIMRCNYIFLMEEMTQGAYVKEYWAESVLSVVGFLVGALCLFKAEEA